MELSRTLNAGRFISRGRGRHTTRVIDSYELILVISGTLEMFEEDREFRLAAGDRLVLRPGCRHGGLAAYCAELSFFWCHFLPRGPESEERLLALAGMAPAARPERFAEDFGRLLAEQRDGGNSVRLDLLGELLLSDAAEEPDAGGDRVPAQLAQKAAELIRLRFEEDISTASLAMELGCHPDYLGRIFRRNFGCSVVAAINQARIRFACKELCGSRKSVKEIAFEAGFNDPAYFRRQFFRQTASTPGEYRRERLAGHINTE